MTTLIKTCRSERKAEDYQQVVSSADQLLAPSLSPLSSRFATICHNYNYDFMTAARLPWARTIRLQHPRDALYLVRPDGYIALASFESSVSKLRTFLEQFRLRFPKTEH